MATMFYLASVFFYLKARIIQQGAVDEGQRTEVSGQGAEGLSAFGFQLFTPYVFFVVRLPF